MKTDIPYNIDPGPIQAEQFKILRGANYFSGGPIVLFTINLNQYDEVFTNEVEGFYEHLSNTIPSLVEHHCSEGVRGGFYIRLKEGTLFGHVMEHIAIELQSLAGMPVSYGKTRSTLKQGVYNVIFRFMDEQAGIIAGMAALNLINSFLNKTNFNLQKAIDIMIQLREKHLPGPTTQSIIDEAEERNIPWQRLDDNNLIQLGTGKHSQRIRASLTQKTSALANDTVRDRKLCLNILKDAEIPCISFESISSDNKSLLKAGIYCKRYRNNDENNISLILSNSDSETARPKIFKNEEIIRFHQTETSVWRFLMIDKKIAGVCRLIPPILKGDGISNIRELIAKVNEENGREIGDKGCLSFIKESKELTEQINIFNYSPYSIPEIDKIIPLGATANPKNGTYTIAYNTAIDKELKSTLEKCTQILNLDIAGIDAGMNDPSKGFNEGEGIKEVFISPDFRMHINPAEGKYVNPAKAFLQYLFPFNTASRIPLIAVTGSKGKTSLIRILQYLFKDQYPDMGIIDSDQFSIGERVYKQNKITSSNIQLMLRDPSIDMAIAEIPTRIITENGLAYDFAETGIVLNNIADQNNKHGFHNTEDLAYCHNVITEQVHKNGHSILFADDPLIVENADLIDVPIIWLSKTEKPLIKVLKKSDMILSCNAEFIILQKEGKSSSIVRINEIPDSWKDNKNTIHESVLAAIAISIIYPNSNKSGLSKILEFIKNNEA